MITKELICDKKVTLISDNVFNIRNLNEMFKNDFNVKNLQHVSTNDAPKYKKIKDSDIIIIDVSMNAHTNRELLKSLNDMKCKSIVILSGYIPKYLINLSALSIDLRYIELPFSFTEILHTLCSNKNNCITLEDYQKEIQCIDDAIIIERKELIANIELAIDEKVKALKIEPFYVGFQYLKDCISYYISYNINAINNGNRNIDCKMMDVYRYAAKKNGKQWCAIERSIRTAIESVYYSPDGVDIFEIALDGLQFFKRPSNGTVIKRIAKKIFSEYWNDILICSEHITICGL